jgi:riboflavin kinase/FMN adenylyltransferase
MVHCSALMQVIRSISTLASPLVDSLVTIGNFDGFHRGHQELLAQVKRHRQRNEPVVVMTFDPHPIEVLRPEIPFTRLSDSGELIELLSAAGVDYLVIEPFSKAYSQISAAEFLRDIVLRPLQPKWLVVGYDFHFGKDRGGDFELVKAVCKEAGVQTEQVKPLQMNGETVSSRGIREAVRAGDLTKARQWLTRDFNLSGPVVHGAGRGKGLGFATLNIELHERTLPKQGVYATRATVHGRRYPSVTNVGVAPTFGSKGPVRVECHVLDADLEAYGEKVKIEFVERLRDEIKFSSVEMLKKQISEDVQKAREILLASNG